MQPSQKIERYQAPLEEKSLGALLSELAGHSATLVRDEMTLARQEVREKIRTLQTPLLVLGVAALSGLLGAMSLCAAVILGLASYFKPWQAALIMGIVLCLAAGALLAMGLSRMKQTSLKPEQTLETLEENREWLKELT